MRSFFCDISAIRHDDMLSNALFVVTTVACTSDRVDGQRAMSERRRYRFNATIVDVCDRVVVVVVVVRIRLRA
jgi:hypothetical protein